MANLETIKKVNTYVQNVCKEINANQETASVSDLIDFGAMLDEIKKKAEDTSKKIKKELLSSGTVSSKKIEAEGVYFRVRYSEREKATIDPAKLQEELDNVDFLKCVTVNLTKTKKNLDEKIINSLKVIDTPTQQLSFQKKG